MRTARLCYVAVNEGKRSTMEEEPVKSLDFVVQPSPESRLLIDVKGRQFPGGKATEPRFIWQNWCTQEDIDGLLRWEHQFGNGSQALLVFMYHLLPSVDIPLGTDDLWIWKKRRYLIRAISVQSYREVMRVRSPKWKTVHLKMADFRSLIRPFREWINR